ncbi:MULTISPECIES: AsmA family protein [Halomonadaceae]|uniref:AsmA family protein n=1 Tax=Halomonadaceae TaxID=28256 RepID=UPI001ABF36E8|nr:AsmA family protein [Halomonas sp. TA6]
MTRAVKWIGAVVGLLLLLLVAIVLFLESAWMRGWLEGQASDRLGGREVEIGELDIDWGSPLTVRLQALRIANVDWAEPEEMVRLDELAIAIAPGALFRGEVELKSVRVERPEIHLVRRDDGVSNWDDLVQALDEEEQADTQEGPAFWPESFAVRQGRLTYRDVGLDTQLDVIFQTPDETIDELRLALEGEGRLQEEPLAFTAMASYEGRQQRGRIEELEGHVGASALAGELALDLGRDTPYVMARLDADELDLNRWGVLDARVDEQAAPDDVTAEERPAQEEVLPGQAWDRQLADALGFLDELEGQLDLSIARLIYADQTLSEVVIEGQLEQGRLTVERLHALQATAGEEQGALDASGWIAVRNQRPAAELEARFDQLDLTAALAPLGLDDLGTLDGRLNARMLENELVFDDSALDYQGPAYGIALSVRADSQPIEGADRPGVHLVGDATYEGEPFAFDLLVGSLLDLTDDETAYPVSGELSTGDTTLYVNGHLEHPFELAAVVGDFRLEGPTPAQLSGLVGIELPELPAYRVSTHLEYRDDLLHLQGLEGGVGGSDVAGDIRVQLGEQPMIWATLSSETFDFDDWLDWMEEEIEEQSGLFSDDPWEVDALRGVDAEVEYRAANVQANYVPLTDVNMVMLLERGILTLEPLQVGLGGGQVTSWLTLNAQQEALSGDLRIEVDQVNLKPLLREAGIPEVAEDTIGTIGGLSELSFEGRSLAEVMAGLDGTLELAMSQGWLDILAAELLPLNVGNALVEALAGSGQVELQCSYLKLVADDGLVRLDEFFMATEGAHLVAAGAINLDTEAMDMAFEGHNKDFTIFTANSPVELEGPLEDLNVNVVTPEFLARGLASMLGALVAPPAAILPWIDLGGGEEVGMGCDQALAEYHSDAQAPSLE